MTEAECTLPLSVCLARSSPPWSAVVCTYAMKGLPGGCARDLLAAVQDESADGGPSYPVSIMQPKYRYKAVDLLCILLISSNKNTKSRLS